MKQINSLAGLGCLGPEDTAFITSHLQKMTVPAGTKVFETGNTCSAFLMVLDGCVRVQMIGETGREIVLYRVEDGQTCILTTSCLLSGDLYSAEAVTECETTAVALPVQQFKELLNRSQAFRDLVFLSYGQRISNLVSLVEEVAFGRVDVRLAQFLRDRADDEGLLKKTHYELAVELGSAREVVSRQLKEFEKKGWIVLMRGQVKILDPKGLEGFISA